MSNRKLGAVGLLSGPEDIPKLPSALAYKGQALHLLGLRTMYGGSCDYVLYGAERSEHAGQTLGS